MIVYRLDDAKFENWGLKRLLLPPILLLSSVM